MKKLLISLFIVGKVILVIFLLTGCPQESGDIGYTPVNYDSLFSLGDSAIKHHYIEQAHYKLTQDSLSREMIAYKDQLINREQVEAQIRERVIFKDTVIYQKKRVVQEETIYSHTYIHDTIIVFITDTVRLSKREARRRNKK